MLPNRDPWGCVPRSVLKQDAVHSPKTRRVRAASLSNSIPLEFEIRANTCQG